MRNRTAKNRIGKIGSLVLLLAALVSSVVVVNLYAKYISRGTKVDQASAAAFVVNIHQNNEPLMIDLSDLKRPGDSKVVKFAVSNDSRGAVSEVDQKYSMDFKLNGSMPVEIVIRKTGANAASFTGPSTVDMDESLDSLPVTKKWTDDALVLKGGSSQTHDFELTATWPESCNDIRYASGSAIGNLVLTVVTEQID